MKNLLKIKIPTNIPIRLCFAFQIKINQKFFETNLMVIIIKEHN